MECFRVSPKFCTGLCLVWVWAEVSVCCSKAWADEPLLSNPSPLGGINLGGAVLPDDDVLPHNPDPKATPLFGGGGSSHEVVRFDDDTLVPKYTPGLNTGGMGTGRFDDDTLVPNYTPGLNTGGMDTGRFDDDTLVPKYTPGLNTGGMDTGRLDDDTLVPKYTPGLNTGGMGTSASLETGTEQGKPRSSDDQTDPLGLAPIIKKIFGGG